MKKLMVNIIRALTMLSLILFLKGCSEREVEIQNEIISPNGMYIAYAYNFKGGATVGFSQRVSIIKSDESKVNDILVSDSPNIFFNTNTNSEDVEIEWEDDSTLKITCDENGAYVKLKVDIFDRIKIKYE